MCISRMIMFFSKRQLSLHTLLWTILTFYHIQGGWINYNNVHHKNPIDINIGIIYKACISYNIVIHTIKSKDCTMVTTEITKVLG
jgi:hypothetical protein